MAQFLLISTMLTMAGLIATIVVGFLATPVQAAQHIMLALITVVLGLFSQSMTMFFFIGTGRQIKDKVKGTEHEAAVRQSTRTLSMRVSPIATYAMAMLMITFITGGGVGSGKTPRWVHDLLSLGTLIVFARAYWIELKAMIESARLMEKYLSD